MKINLTTLFLFVLAVVAGAGLMRWWDVSHGIKEAAQMQAIFEAQPNTDSVLDVNLQAAQLAEGVAEKEAAPSGPQKGSDLPTQLSPINLEGVSEVYAYKKPEAKNELAEELASKQAPAPVDLSGVSGQVPAATDNAQQAMPSNITMIEVPVKARVIATGADYKQFKQTARGSYPAADFDTEQVVVLESQSNLPDKVFEIADVRQMVVLYRVNVFGLDEKTNTHSAAKMPKTDLPVVLKQVL